MTNEKDQKNEPRKERKPRRPFFLAIAETPLVWSRLQEDVLRNEAELLKKRFGHTPEQIERHLSLVKRLGEAGRLDYDVPPFAQHDAQNIALSIREDSPEATAVVAWQVAEPLSVDRDLEGEDNRFLVFDTSEGDSVNVFVSEGYEELADWLGESDANGEAFLKLLTEALVSHD